MLTGAACFLLGLLAGIACTLGLGALKHSGDQDRTTDRRRKTDNVEFL